MAKATIVGEVTLTLNRHEAQVLANILGKVGGDPNQSDRRYCGSIYDALSHVGIYSEGTTDRSVGSIDMLKSPAREN